MNKTQSRLGRGLSALIPPAEKAAFSPPMVIGPAVGQAEGVLLLSLSAITPNSLQPRTEFSEEALDDLAASLKLHGVLQPIMVRPLVSGNYEIVAGERRLRAAERAGLVTIPAIARSLSDEESLTVALIENIQRENLNPIEAARGYRQLMDNYSLTQAQLGQQIGKKQSTISNLTGLLKLPIEIQNSIADGRLSVEHGKILLSIDSPSEQTMLWRDFLDLKMSRSDARSHAKLSSLMSSSSESPPKKDHHWVDLEDRLRRAIGTKVAFRPGRSGGGTVTIHCSSEDELEGLLDKLAS